MSKYPVTGPRMLRTLNVDGDGQGDIWRGYDGEIRAVLASPTTTGDSGSDATTSNAACGGANTLVRWSELGLYATRSYSLMSPAEGGSAFDPFVGQVDDGSVGAWCCSCNARWGHRPL